MHSKLDKANKRKQVDIVLKLNKINSTWKDAALWTNEIIRLDELFLQIFF